MLKHLLPTLLIPGLYLGVMTLMYRWIHGRLFKRAQAGAEALEQAGAKILSVQRSKGFMKPAEVELEFDGKPARYQVRSYSRDYILQTVRLPARPLPAILVRAERGFDRLGKSLGLNREVQLGDQAFDDAAYLASSAPD